jgi:hypothetical protein
MKGTTFISTGRGVFKKKLGPLGFSVGSVAVLGDGLIVFG